MREEQVEKLLNLDAALLTRVYRMRGDRLARMQEHEMPAVIIEREEELVAEARTALERRGILPA